jgi:membrane fusion protein (multidrug efflux system)
MEIAIQETRHESAAIPAGLRNPSKAGAKRKKFLLLGALLAAGAIWSAYRYAYGLSHEETNDAQVESRTVPVLARIGGFVEKVYVADNQPVKSGDTLFILDTRDLEIRLKLAQAKLVAALSASRNGSADAGLAAARSQERIAKSNIAAAQARFDKAAKDLQRFRDLTARDVVTRSQLDAAEFAYKDASASLTASKEQVRNLSFGVAGADAKLRMADAGVLEAQAEVEAAQLQLVYAVVRAPITGTVAKKSLELGQLVSAGQPLLFVVDTQDPWVIANFKETQTAKLAVGQRAEVTVDGYPGLELHGRIESIQPATGARFSLFPPDNATGNFTKVVQRVPVKIILDPETQGGRDLKPGMSAYVTVFEKSI